MTGSTTLKNMGLHIMTFTTTSTTTLPCKDCIVLARCRDKYIYYYTAHKRISPPSLTSKAFARTQLTIRCPMLKEYIYNYISRSLAYQKLHKYMMEDR